VAGVEAISINNVVEDISPQLGGDLDLNGKNIDFPTTANISDCLDEDNMASDSATMLATQQSIKAYVDTHAALLDPHTNLNLSTSCGYAGFVSTASYGAWFSVAQSDASAYVQNTYHCKEAGDYKIGVMAKRTDGNAVVDGQLSALSIADGVVDSNNLINGENFDMTLTDVGKTYITERGSAISLLADTRVAVTYMKDANEGAGTLYVAVYMRKS